MADDKFSVDFDNLLSVLWYFIPGIIIILPIMLIAPEYIKIKSDMFLVVIFTIGFIVHQLFRFLTFDKCHNELSNKVMKLIKEKLKSININYDKNLYGIFDFYFLEGEEQSKYSYLIKKMNFFYFTVGTCAYAFFLSIFPVVVVFILKVYMFERNCLLFIVQFLLFFFLSLLLTGIGIALSCLSNKITSRRDMYSILLIEATWKKVSRKIRKNLF
ncbi:MAG: hypothetical protein V1859_06255 [archaeon]